MALIIDYGRHFTHWDELMHWGKMTQEMLRLDKFYTDPASELLVHKYYPPGVPIFEMLWCRMSGGWSEAGQTMSLHFLIFSANSVVVCAPCVVATILVFADFSAFKPVVFYGEIV